MLQVRINALAKFVLYSVITLYIGNVGDLESSYRLYLEDKETDVFVQQIINIILFYKQRVKIALTSKQKL